ncbi:hydantoinase/oxoprolinase family protein [Streptomyces sp. NPDC048506]|uniref:hydantoinase/oxoprolinase family protein n=1 Tax=Streptomyces sp. NPDC048506 TaxID=3155028 RepID=UPI00341DB0C6
MRIGIDVGGTNTDAVLMDGDAVLAEAKVTTTPDVTSGIVQAVQALQDLRAFDPGALTGVMLGTTHFINAIVEGRDLAPTAAVRLGLPATQSLPPLVGWPKDLVSAIGGHTYLCHGGYEYDGRVISELVPDELHKIADDLAAKKVRSVAVTSVFSLVNPEFECRAAEILTRRLPGLRVSLSHELGRTGLLERENATVLNAALGECAERICDGMVTTLRAVGLHAPLYLSQNDGTLMGVDYARQYPVMTFASGPTNSMRGAAYLSGVDDCAVVDVGGTTTDVGMLHHGFPREASTEVSVGGIRTNFRMPDVLSLGIGGGSVVRQHGSAVRVGPDSVGYRLQDEALVFGGQTLTATDLVVAAGIAEIGEPERVASLDRGLVTAGLAYAREQITGTIDRIRTSKARIPVVLVGGGGFLLPDELPLASSVLRPDHFAVANAVGAAIAKISGDVDRIFAVQPGQRDSTLDIAKQEAIDRALIAGAAPGTVEIVELEEIPLAYLPGNATRIRVKAVGDLAPDTSEDFTPAHLRGVR